MAADRFRDELLKKTKIRVDLDRIEHKLRKICNNV
jgi:hypothetical protein